MSSLANQLFAALPGSAPPDHTGPPSPAARIPGGGGSGELGTPTPALAPTSADAPSSPADVPRVPAAVPPVLAPVPSPGVDVRSAPVSAPSTPYYFLAEASSFPGQGSGLPASAPLGSPVATRVEPAAFGFPGEDELQKLLTVLPDELGARPDREKDGERYFLTAAPRQPASQGYPPFDVQAVRRDFPILSERVNGRPLVWLDNAATTQKPRAVIDRLSYFYEHENSNVHRAAHELAARATDAYEGARAKVARFLNASSAEEIVFVRGATEAINLVAQTWGRQNIGSGDEIVISHLEHHANIVPWQRLAAETGAKLKVIPVDDDGQLLLEEYQRLLGERTKLVAVTQVSNALGTVTPIQAVIDLGHRAGACVLVDGAQSVSHLRVDVQALDADFFVFSGHKVFGPTGIGVVYGKAAVLDAMPPWQAGGNMIRDVTLERSTYQDAPTRFEAGTGNIADAVGLGAALDYLSRLGIENVARYEHELLTYATHAMLEVAGLRLVGTAPDKASVLSFVLAGYTPEQVGQALSRDGIAVRAGHHCAQPILRRFGLEATVRPSLALYNTTDEVDQLVGVLHRLAADSGRGRR